MPNILENFLSAAGFALFEYRGSGAFRPLAKLPSWFTELWSFPENSTAALALSEQSPVLENFLLEAEDFWVSPDGPARQSETWLEKSSAGREIPLQAKAMLIGGKRVIAIFSPGLEFREQSKLLQTARNALLDHERLAREIQKKEILLHCIVHDLSQPLSVMHVAMDCLSDEAVSDHSKQFLKLGMLASNQQETMIRDILNTFSDDLRASLNAGTEESASTDLLECARKTTTSLGPTFEAKGVRLGIASATDQSAKWPVRAEESRLQRIFSNLLENALRYSPVGSNVTVGLENEGEFLRAYIEDEGPGLPKDLRPEQVFGLFMKGKQSGGKAGLGLYFCRITVERWGGGIGCVSLPEKGSRFWFRLPLAGGKSAGVPAASPALASGSNAESRPGAARPLRILFADDQKDIRALTSHQLKRCGHQVTPAKDGKDALKKFRSAPYDVILLDQEMPGMTGDQVARAIRKGEAGKKNRTFLIASTGNSSAEDIRRLKEAGFDTVLGKPFQMEDLNAMLSSISVASAVPLSPPKPPAPSATDLTALLARIGGDEKLLQRMLHTFLRDTPRRVAAITAALRRKDAEALGSLSHALKGAVSIFGAEAARKLSQELQEIGRAGNLSGAAGALNSLKEEIANLLENLRGYAKQSPARPRSKGRKRRKPPRNRGKRQR